MVAAGLVGLVAMAGLVVDGGNAWAQQRGTQNATDAVAEAGAVVLLNNMICSLDTGSSCTTKTDADVLAAVEAAADENGIEPPDAWYVSDYDGQNRVGTVGDGSIPASAVGVEAAGSKDFETYLASVIGFHELTATANATAVAGAVDGVCPAAAGCGMLPVTFPVTTTTCAGNAFLEPGTDTWPIVGYDGVNEPAIDDMAIVPLCDTPPGNVGWLNLDSSPGTNLSDEISDPSHGPFELPVWLDSQTGNSNSVQTAMETYIDQVVLIPLYDEERGSGTSKEYHVTKFVGFYVDEVHIQGGNHPECNSAPGGPPVGGNGSTGCLKGWFVLEITKGPVGAISTDPDNPSTSFGVQLVD